MTYDVQVPEALKKTQQWFGSIISRPIDVNSCMNPTSPTGIPMAEEAWQYIVPSPTLQPAQRIELYNQQYWWRLLSTMHEIFPTVTRLFGYHDFNQTISIPYLCKYPPRHWSLHYVGDKLLDWIQEDYHADDKELVYNAARVDWAYTDSFITPFYDLNLPNPDDFSSVLDKTLYLQPHATIFELPYDMFLFRTEFLEHDPDYWVENDFPPLPLLPDNKNEYFVIYRNRGNDVAVEKISHSEYRLLQHFQSGSSIEAICQWLEHQDESLTTEAGEKLHLWFQQWTFNQFLSLTKP